MASITTITFAPTINQAFQFQAQLDGQQYVVSVPWNAWGRRYYVETRDLSGKLVYATPLIGSPPWYNFNLVGPAFDTQLVYRTADQQFEII